MNIADYVLYHARFSPQKPALAFTGGVATYGMMGSAIHASANRIREAGLRPGGLVAIDVRNPFHHLVIIFALERCGLTSVSVHTSFTVTVSGLKPVAVILDRFGSPIPGAGTVAVDDGWFILDPVEPSADGPGIAEDQYQRVFLSSGTTGVPKAVGLSTRVMERRIMDGIVWSSGGDRALTMAGFSTVGAIGPLFTLASGGLACFAPNPEETLHLIRLFNITQVTAMAGQLQGLIEQQTKNFEPCPSLQRLTVGGSQVPEPLLSGARSLLCSNLVLAYGTTETGVVAYGRAAAVMGADVTGADGAVGYVAPWAKVEAVDDAGVKLAAGQTGRLRLWSDKTAEYVAERPEDRAVLTADGWFYPGDIGLVRENGLLAVSGRANELINRGGAIVAPQLIEDVLMERAEIAQAGVFEVGSDGGFPQIWAAVVPKEGFDEEKIFRFCRHRLGDKTPDVLVPVDDIPRTDTGKIIRHRLREIAVQRRNRAPGGGGQQS